MFRRNTTMFYTYTSTNFVLYFTVVLANSFISLVSCSVRHKPLALYFKESYCYIVMNAK